MNERMRHWHNASVWIGHNTLQHAATQWETHCNTLQHTARHWGTHCNTLQHTAAHWETHCNTLQHTAARCSALQHAAAHCNTMQHTLQRTATHCNMLRHAATHCNTHGNALHHTATHCNTLQHTATHCNTLQHIATHSNTLQNTPQRTALRCITLQHSHANEWRCHSYVWVKSRTCISFIWMSVFHSYESVYFIHMNKSRHTRHTHTHTHTHTHLHTLSHTYTHTHMGHSNGSFVSQNTWDTRMRRLTRDTHDSFLLCHRSCMPWLIPIVTWLLCVLTHEWVICESKHMRHTNVLSESRHTWLIRTVT